MDNINPQGDSQSFVKESQGSEKCFNDQEVNYDQNSQNFYPTQQAQINQNDTGNNSQQIQYTLEATQITEINQKGGEQKKTPQQEYYQGLVGIGGEGNPDED